MNFKTLIGNLGGKNGFAKSVRYLIGLYIDFLVIHSLIKNQLEPVNGGINMVEVYCTLAEHKKCASHS